MDVVDAKQARIAEEAGACAVMVRLTLSLSLFRTGHAKTSEFVRLSNVSLQTSARKAASHACLIQR
jgi:pyridoxal biosynthesis lyase PdxS